MHDDFLMAKGVRKQAAVLTAGGLLAQLPLYCFLLVGDLAWSLKERAVQELAKVQLREFSQDPLLFGILFGAIPALLLFFCAPTVGAWSDRTRTRAGRRIPFLLAIAPLLAGSLALLALSEPIADFLLRLGDVDPARREFAVVACIAACWTLFEVFSLASNALFIALVNDTVPHHIIGRFFGLFRIVSLSVGAVFFYVVFDEDLPAKASNVMLVVAAIYLAAFLMLCRYVREPAYPPAVPAQRGFTGRLRADRSGFPWFFVALFAAVGIATISFLPVNVNAYNALAQYGVGRSSFGQALALTYCISIVLAMPLGWLADRVHPLRIGLGTLALYAACMVCGWLLVTGPRSFLVWLVLHGVLSGAFLSGTAALLPRVLPRERFSELAAFSAAITAGLAMAVSLGVGLLLDMSGRNYSLIFPAAGALAAIGAATWYYVMHQHEDIEKTRCQ
ncbi:MFS transporter [Pseudoduganella sp. OTU4001]|uniref:MFS transporter n=1 Tax=Pseudoduganella sp. OTU4001 TaxID=3043854 RepID=UPI00313A8838